MLVPGTFACSNMSHVPLATSSRSMTEKLQAYFAWAREDPRVAGMARRERFLELIALCRLADLQSIGVAAPVALRASAEEGTLPLSSGAWRGEPTPLRRAALGAVPLIDADVRRTFLLQSKSCTTSQTGSRRTPLLLAEQTVSRLSTSRLTMHRLVSRLCWPAHQAARQRGAATDACSRSRPVRPGTWPSALRPSTRTPSSFFRRIRCRRASSTITTISLWHPRQTRSCPCMGKAAGGSRPRRPRTARCASHPRSWRTCRSRGM